MKTIVSKSNLSALEKEFVFQLWNDEYPAKICYQFISEFDAYLDNLSNVTHYLLHDKFDMIQGGTLLLLETTKNGLPLSSILKFKIKVSERNC
jgi:hypothetical protein